MAKTAFKDIELVDLGEKLGCLEFLIKAGLYGIPVVGPLMMMMVVKTNQLEDLYVLAATSTVVRIGSR